jgi:SAM-dependent methyltransferase
VLSKEFETAIKMCDIKSEHTVLNILAGGTPLENFFPVHPTIYNKYEVNPEFSSLENIQLCTMDKIPESNDSVDRIITLAALHHIQNSERIAYYKECWRILKPQTGKLIIGDVIKHSKEARWLNEFVNKYNLAGHNGLFFTELDKIPIEENGLTVEIQIKSYPWIFDTEVALVDFCRNLFGLDLATNLEILDGINHYLRPEYQNNKIVINWTLIYFISTKHQIFPQC